MVVATNSEEPQDDHKSSEQSTQQRRLAKQNPDREYREYIEEALRTSEATQGSPWRQNTATYLRLSDVNNVVSNLDRDLESLRVQLEQLKLQSANSEQMTQVADRLNEIYTTIDKAQEKSKELKADILLPPTEEMNVRLVPSHSLDRLEEYRGDENKAYLLIGVFLGAILGILSNWATNENFVITRPSAAFMGLLVILALVVSGWAYQVNRRASRVRNRMLYPNTSELPKGRVEDRSVK